MHAFGDNTWKKGLNYYLNSRANNSANSDHLYEGLQKALNEDVPPNNLQIKTVMGSWEHQSGFPLVTVRRQGTALILSQQRFLYTNATSNNLWWIPVNYIVGSDPNVISTEPDFWINGVPSVTLQPTIVSKPWTSNDWIIVNIHQKYYYRVNYDQSLWDLIIQQLNSADNGFEKIHLRNRAQLIDDSFHLARANKIDFSILFGLMNYLSKELDYIPWVAANRASTSLNRWLSGSNIYALYQKFVQTNVAPLFNRLGVELIANEQRVDRYARTVAINLACQAQLPECLEQTNAALLNFVYSKKSIAPDYVSTIYCNGLRTTDSIVYKFMKDKMLASTVSSERNTIITALGCMQSKNELNDFLALAITPDVSLSRAEKSRILTAAVGNGEETLEILMEFIEKHYRNMHAMDDGSLDAMLSSISQRIGSNKLYDRFVGILDEMLKKNVITESNQRTYKDNSNTNLQWQRENIFPIIEFFNNQQNQQTTPTTTEEYSSTTQASGRILISSILIIFCVSVQHIFA
jgi:aminopeptidase N